MEAGLALLVVLAGVSHGMETSCDATQDGARCYGALGGTVYLQLMTDARGKEFIVYKEPGITEILKMKRYLVLFRVVLLGPSKDRSEFYTNNGTLKIRNTTREDSAEYRVEITDPDTGNILNTRLQLFIEAPVSSPQLSPEYLSQGEVRVSCSSEGDGPRYSWTVPGTAVVLSGGDTSTVTLKRGSSGELICTAKNHVSSAAGHLNISPCPGLLYINCTSPNGTQISDWVNATGNTLCLKPTTVAPATQTTTPPTKGSESFDIASCEDPGFSALVYVKLAEVFTLLAVCLGLCCYYKTKTRPQKHGDKQDEAVLEERVYENRRVDVLTAPVGPGRERLTCA